MDRQSPGHVTRHGMSEQVQGITDWIHTAMESHRAANPQCAWCAHEREEAQWAAEDKLARDFNRTKQGSPA